MDTMLALAATTNTTTTMPSIDLNQLVGAVITNPSTYITVVIELLLGLGLGYVAAKALRYILAAVGIVLLGIFLGVWSIGNSVQESLARLSTVMKKLLELGYMVASMLGILVVGPVTVGFILGALIAHMRK